jgi:hypothetical protein
LPPARNAKGTFACISDVWAEATPATAMKAAAAIVNFVVKFFMFAPSLVGPPSASPMRF